MKQFPNSMLAGQRKELAKIQVTADEIWELIKVERALTDTEVALLLAYTKCLGLAAQSLLTRTGVMLEACGADIKKPGAGPGSLGDG